MDPNTSTTNTEAELESFRQKWKEEVTARTKAKASPVSKAPALTAAASSSRSHVPKSNAPDAASHSHARQSSVEHGDDVTPHEYHDLGEKHHGRRLDETSAQAAAAASASKEPSSALDHYEKAVEKESQGSLGDSVNLYRKAFKVGIRGSTCSAIRTVLTTYSSTPECTNHTKQSTSHPRSSNPNPKHRNHRRRWQHQRPRRKNTTLPTSQEQHPLARFHPPYKLSSTDSPPSQSKENRHQPSSLLPHHVPSPPCQKNSSSKS